MKFAELYQNNKRAVKDTLTAMWCSNPNTPTQRAYSEQIRRLIETELFASENYVPLVQCMDRYESVKTVSREEAEKLVGGLWKKSIGEKDYPPYEHQYQAWKALTNTGGAKKSMVVTTGTGSGKTECFMLPLVNNLLQNPQNGIGAIFLYPLNALMEDQKERLQNLLKDTDLHFAVYNGNLPEKDPGENAADAKDKKLHERICKERETYANIIATRDEMRNSPPNIILTNPTMLEYMLLRNKDQKLFTPDSLKWIVIDETHTFSGAGAAELAMLIRRVLDAFGTKAQDVRFATSSATIGNAKTQEDAVTNNDKLRQFISDISGVALEQVELITGKRVPTAESADEEKERCRKLLSVRDYVRLDELFTEGTIEEKLKRLDEMCEGDAPLKAKVHFFYRVPNNGLRVQLTKTNADGSFKIESHIPLEESNTPYLELARCEHCGEYFAMAETVSPASNKYQAVTKGIDDIFAFDSNNKSGDKIFFGLRQNIDDNKDGTTLVNIINDELQAFSNPAQNGWNIALNVKKCCPHCGRKLIGKQGENKDESTDNDNNAQLFRLPADFISRVLAPSILPQMKPADDNPENKPHNGQQYISFVDSRQAAARSTLKQNQDYSERFWVFSRLFNELNRIKLNVPDNTDEILKWKNKLELTTDEDDRQLYQDKIDTLECNSTVNYLSWGDAFDHLKKQRECKWFCYQFANKSESSDEIDEHNADEIRDEVINKYIHSIMIEQLSKRPRTALAPETMGLFTTYYPKLEKIKELPEAVRKFNEKYLNKDDKKQIDLQEWKNFLKIFMDNVVRSNQSVYLKAKDSNLDIFACQRFGTSKPHRRSVKKPQIGDKKTFLAASIIFLAKLIDPESDNLRNTAFDNKKDINDVLDAMWKNLIDDTQLLQLGWQYKDGRWKHDQDNDGDGDDDNYRLNVVDIAFKLFDKACLCDTRHRGAKFETLRPIETLFMGFSPYLVDEKPVHPKTEFENWKPYEIKDGQDVSIDDIHNWAKENRKILWDNEIWGESGCFTNRLDTVYQNPKIFIQAEHTAQVDKLISKQSQEQFKNQEINILACSTTMEMGVDLGNLELVMMSSIPPHPTNYKQRAGRSGRNDAPRSACITLCSSDAVGWRILESPIEQLINRQMAVPSVDLQSPQVIQRHVNAFLFRLSGIFSNNENGNDNNLDQEVIEFFTPFSFIISPKTKERDYSQIEYKNNAQIQSIYPVNLLGNKEQTKYWQFINFLNNSPETVNHCSRLKELLHDTCYDGEVAYAITQCKADIERCYDELDTVVKDIKSAYERETQNTRYSFLLRHKYSEALSENLIKHFATSRFTPNANMPINVIEFNKDLKNESINYNRKSNNPSYPLQEAISQYAPGNTIVLENRTIVVRGIEYTGMYRQTNTFKKLYSDGNEVVIDMPSKVPEKDRRRWPVNHKTDLTLIEPVTFIPDINEDYSRVIDTNPYTQVSAQLIGVSSWIEPDDSSAMITMRSNRDCGNAKILYYNEGTGYGYTFCQDCGKTILEKFVAKKPYVFPTGMQDQLSKPDNNHPFHYKINSRHDNNKRIKCGKYPEKIHRNVILGGLIQTDYCEIKIQNHNDWLQRRDEPTDKLLITIGILITNNFAEYIGKERKDIDFTITPNAHLCVFDTNSGGSGYSNQLANKQTMQDVLELCKSELEKITTKDALLDKSTIRYLDKLDIEGARKWIEAALKSYQTVPETITKIYPNAKVGFIEQIIDDCKNATAGNEKSLFVSADWCSWVYKSDSDTLGWQQRINDIRKSDNKPKVCIIIKGDKEIPLPKYADLRSISDWAGVCSVENKMPYGLVPIAKVKDNFYFTDEQSTTSLNYNWARGAIYRISIEEAPSFIEEAIDVNFIPVTSKKITLNLDKAKKVKSKQLGGIIDEALKNLVLQFKTHCEQNPTETLRVVYQDEHLKSILGMVVTLQFIEHFVKKFRLPFTLRFVNEDYWENRKCDNIFSNIENDADRNEYIRLLSEPWIESLSVEQNLSGKLLPIDTKPQRSLPHWRELRFECAGKALVLYPNGGIINEWFLDTNSAQRRYNMDDTTTAEDILLYRNKEIMYDAEIKNN
ncbi:MAG: DEAD/DEAH box helicase [Bacteroidales bacterium]|jgi:hypothetical protein|nr:DEAD/DEAH box helicase [Bacteroidales bacterium]